MSRFMILMAIGRSTAINSTNLCASGQPQTYMVFIIKNVYLCFSWSFDML